MSLLTFNGRYEITVYMCVSLGVRGSVSACKQCHECVCVCEGCFFLFKFSISYLYVSPSPMAKSCCAVSPSSGT